MKTIRTDIPIPIDAGKRGPKPKYSFDRLEVGGSFAIADEEILSVRVLICRKNKVGHAKFLSGRHTDKRGIEQWRCWRIE